MNSPPTSPNYSWAIRRRVMFTILIFCMLTVGYVLWKQLDTKVAETVVVMAFVIIGTVLTTYVFAATHEDIQRGNLFKDVIK